MRQLSPEELTLRCHEDLGPVQGPGNSVNSCSFEGYINLGFTDLHRIPSTLEKVLEPLITTWRGFVCVHFFFFIGGSCRVLKGPLIGEMLKHYLECQANFLAA